MSGVKQGPDWVLVNEKADWQGRDSQGEFVYDGHIWVLGGWFALNLAIVATLYFKPLRALRYLRSPEPRPLAFAHRRSRPHVR